MFRILIIFILALHVHQEAATSTKEKKPPQIKLSVYYETLCPDSMQFIKEQLQPLMITSVGKYVDLELVPYGKAKTTGHYQFSCQHGAAECKGNMIHSCALKIYQPKEAQKFIFCSMGRYRPPNAGESCSKDLGLEYRAVKDCSENSNGTDYLAENGEKTHGLNPSLYFVPWIVFQNSWDKKKMDRALDNLKEVVCEELGQEHCT